MAGGIERIKSIDVSRLLKKKGTHCDGRGLYLKVLPTGAASWILRYMADGRAHTMGLGSYPNVGLKEARQLAIDAQRVRAGGKDPIQTRQSEKQAKLVIENVVTFERAAKDFISSKRSGWRDGGKTENQWTSCFRDWVNPKIGKCAVSEIAVQDVFSILTQPVKDASGSEQALWQAKSETASRCRSRIENVLDFAKAKGWRTGENPADWGTLRFMLPKRSDVRAVKHHPAMPYEQVPNFIRVLRDRSNVSRNALEFTILTAARSAEVLGMKWEEVDLTSKVWAIAASRMKGKKAHRVPLTDPAIAILQSLSASDKTGLVFARGKLGKPLSNNTMRKILQTLAGADVTVHGFRSTFAVWTREKTSFPRELAEASLAHTVGDAVERAYARTDFFDKRRELMESWAEHCRSSQ